MSPLLAGSVAQRLRILSGLVLFSFALTHFLNHALGVWSVEAMEAAQVWRKAVTRSTVGTTILAGALLTHITLNIVRVGRRSSWRMPAWEAIQIASGLTIPILLFPHIAEVRGSHELVGFDDRYTNVLAGLWPGHAWRQSILLLVVWTHACIGLHFWLRLSPRYRRVFPVAVALAVAIPALGLSGFVSAGRDAAAARAAQAAATASSNYGYEDDYGSSGSSDYGADSGGGYSSGGYGYDDYGPSAETLKAQERAALLATLIGWTPWIASGIGGTVAAILLARWIIRRFRRKIRVRYAAGPDVHVPPGPSLLDISRGAGVPHASVCGGRARCSTCRVRIDGGADGQPAPSRAESATLERVGAPADIRLACQLRPRGDLSVTRLVQPPVGGRRPSLAMFGETEGAEHVLAVLFLDIRGFTAIAQARLPYDIVFLLNRFFAEVGEGIGEAGGWIDKYMGDGLMALFGYNSTPEEASRRALQAAAAIDSALSLLNADLEGELPEPLRIGVGLHVGPLVFGRIGHRNSASFTVIGGTVNVASRLEGLAKTHRVQLVASEHLLRTAGLDPSAFPVEEAQVRGAGAMRVALIGRGADLLPHLGAPTARRTRARVPPRDIALADANSFSTPPH